MKGICDKRGFPREVPWLSSLEPHVIVERYNAVIRGFSNFYLGIIRNNSKLHRCIYIQRYSCIKTLAQKYRTTISGIFQRFGHNMYSTSTKTIKITASLKIRDKQFTKNWILLTAKELFTDTGYRQRIEKMQERFWDNELRGTIGEYPIKKGRTPKVTNEDYVETLSWVSLRTSASFDMPCAICGTFEEVEMHHLNHVRKRAYALILDEMTYYKVMALRNRKQIPVCRTCHQGHIHQGKYRGTNLKSLVPKVLYDNRIIHVESYVKPGREYYAKTLEEKGWTERPTSQE